MPLTSGPAPAPQDRRPARLVSRTRSSAPAGRTGADIARIVSDPSTPVFVTVHADGRRRYSYWRPYDPATGQGSCYVALPTDECDRLHAAGRITLGEPVVDATRTTYRVRLARTPAKPWRAVTRRTLAA
ncbi:hypothetical protein [Streptomyces chromofuscus]|uniref:hypothetical protein n=1 Tax=Streptomyces chromofuscus TaxID=42881 RepID=UPI00198EADC8|nr:hypothetical protein [Streptomyces chromofuscus]GGT05899.1 hypothetical protein GCM10010254_27900 [Streptomyces chromofuscus]